MSQLSKQPVVQPLPAVDSPLRGLPAAARAIDNTLMNTSRKGTACIFGSVQAERRCSPLDAANIGQG